MELYCTRFGCPRPQNYFADLDNNATLKTVEQKYCTACGMPLILVGRYLPQQLLGRGGFGAAFLARDRYTPGQRRCVVKQFKPAGELSATQIATAQQLFEREAEVLEEIGNQHEQIPNLYAFFELTVPSLLPGKQDKFFYLVQELIDGNNLESELQAKGKFSEAEVMEVLQAILPVLEFVHHSGSIHRDIKPANIMRHRNGKFYLLDFGAVKQVTKVGATASRQGSTGIYSLGFAPPEQMAGGDIYPSTDLYALAVTAVILLTGKEPAELFDAYSNQWRWRSQVQVSDSLAAVLDRMLLSAPNQRFQSAREVMIALNPTTASLPPQPPVPATTTTLPSVPTTAPPVVTQAQAAFSLRELLGGAAFSGFEGALVAIALYSLVRSPLLTLAVAALILGSLTLAQTRRWIEGKDLLLIPAITLAIVFFLPILRVGLTIAEVVFLATAAALLAIALTAIFRLIYKLLSSMI